MNLETSMERGGNIFTLKRGLVKAVNPLEIVYKSHFSFEIYIFIHDSRDEVNKIRKGEMV